MQQWQERAHETQRTTKAMPRKRKTHEEMIQELKAQLAAAEARQAEADRKLANEQAGIIGRWERAQALENDKVLLRLREAMLPTLGKRDRAKFAGFFDRLDRAPTEASNDVDATAHDVPTTERRKAA